MTSFIINTLTLIVMLFATFGIATEKLNFKFDKMARPIEQELYHALMESELDFIERGVIPIEEDKLYKNA